MTEDSLSQHTLSKRSLLRYQDREALRKIAGHLQRIEIRSAAQTAYWWMRHESWRFSPGRLIQRWQDARFDRLFGVDTTQHVDLSALDLPKEVILHGVYYQPTSAGLARRLLGQLALDHRDFTFIDLGSGKGRVLMIAAQFPFRRVVGVEVSRDLCDIAEKNFAAATVRYAAPVEVVCRSAADYGFDQRRMVVFLANPFDEVILQPVADRIARHLQNAASEIWVIYRSPRCREVLDRTPGLRVVGRIQDSLIYHGKSGPRESVVAAPARPAIAPGIGLPQEAWAYPRVPAPASGISTD